MISSAVVIPDREMNTEVNGSQNEVSTSANMKRKLSHSISSDRKRPKVELSSETLNYDDAPKSATPEEVKPKVIVQDSPPRRRPAPAADEKKRTQRLFGSLLGTLSQTGTKSDSTHRKRDEIEARQRERLKREHEEQESTRKRKKEDLARRRREQQRLWEEESQRLRYANMRAMAGFLRTKSEPVLCYLPWELRPDEEATIQRQKDEVEAIIRQESGDSDAEAMDQDDTSKFDKETPAVSPNVDKHAVTALDNSNPAESANEDRVPSTSPKHEPQEHIGTSELDDSREVLPEKPDVSTDTNGVHIHDDSSKIDDQAGDDLAEGQEEDVIY